RISKPRFEKRAGLPAFEAAPYCVEHTQAEGLAGAVKPNPVRDMEFERHRVRTNLEIADAEEARLEEQAPQLVLHQLACPSFLEARLQSVAGPHRNQLRRIRDAFKLIKIEHPLDSIESQPARSVFSAIRDVDLVQAKGNMDVCDRG